MTRPAIVAGLSALLPAVVLNVPNVAVAETGAPRFAPPERAILTRTVWRYLSDGQQIVVTRRYAVEFTPAAEGGYQLNGSLIEASVDAPSDLAAFAELERKRPDTTTFPIVLDKAGHILSEGRAPDPGLREQGATLARKVIGSAAIATTAKSQALGQVSAISAMSAMAPVPGDLFRPRPGERRETRKLTLPGGTEGEVEVALKVDGAVEGSLPQQVERVVTTRLAGTTKVSREVWTLGSK